MLQIRDILFRVLAHEHPARQFLHFDRFNISGANIRSNFGKPERIESFRPIARVALRKLQMLNAAEDLRTLARLPETNFEKLKGDRQGQYSIRISAYILHALRRICVMM